MKTTGSIGRMQRKIGRALASRESPWFALQPGTALPGPVLTSGPGVLFGVHPQRSECAVPRLVPVFSSFHSYFIPPERKSLWARARREFHEQGRAL